MARECRKELPPASTVAPSPGFTNDAAAAPAAADAGNADAAVFGFASRCRATRL